MNQKIWLEVKKFTGNPKCVLFTDRSKIFNLEKTIKNLPADSAIIIREYDLSADERKIFAQKIIELTQKIPLRQRPKIIIGKDFQLSMSLKCHGIHFSDLSKIPLNFLGKKTKNEFIFSQACHNQKNLRKAIKSKAKMVFISPIFSTTTHKNAKIVGVNQLAKISLTTYDWKPKNSIEPLYRQDIQKKLYALGGINQSNLKSLRKLKLAGIGAIDFLSKNL